MQGRPNPEPYGMQVGASANIKQVVGEETPASLIGHADEATAIDQPEGTASGRAEPLREQQAKLVVQPLLEETEVITLLHTAWESILSVSETPQYPHSVRL